MADLTTNYSMDSLHKISPSIEKLIAGCIKKNRQSQTELYNRFKQKMFVVSLRYFNNREEAEDILQEGFIKVFECIHEYKNADSFEGWVRKNMVNCALQKLRLKKHSHAVTSFDNLCVENIGSENISSRLGTKELLHIIQQLPPACKMVFNLYVFEGMKHCEIAQHLHISEGTSKSNLFAARVFLQSRLRTTQHLEGVYHN